MRRFPRKTDDLMENVRGSRRGAGTHMRGSRMLQILQGQKILHFCALVHA